MDMGTNDISELDTDQSEGIQEKLKFAAKQPDDRVNIHMSPVSEDEYSDLPLPPEHDKILVDHNHKLPSAPKLKTSPHWNNTNFPTLCLSDEELNHMIEQNYKVTKDRTIHSPSYSLVLSHYPMVKMQRQTWICR